MAPRAYQAFGLAIAMSLLAAVSARAFEPGDNQYPNSIMAPEPGNAGHHRAAATRHVKVPSIRANRIARRPTRGYRFATRGSSGSVLPVPVPRTQLIPPEGGGNFVTHALPQEQGPTIVPGAPGLGAVPNLPHGVETFQDRASRCAFQQGLYNVPAGASTQYMGACVQ
jgi:hypothetical protein